MNDRVEVLNYADVSMYYTDWTDAISNVYIGRAEIVEAYEGKCINAVDEIFPFPKTIRFKTLASITKQYKRKTSKFNRRDVFIRDAGMCQYCETLLTKEESTIDHVLPRSRGGLTSWENCVLSCNTCNTKKGNKTPSEAGMRLLKLPAKPTSLVKDFRKR